MYWDINKTLSYNCLFNFIIGNRGGGKTYGFKKRAIDNYLKKGSQFVYVRRYDTEFDHIETFFDDISEAYPELEFKVKDGKFFINDEIAGWYIALTKAILLKSVPFPGVTMIGFDEFIIETGVYHYLKNEVRLFLDLYSSIARDRDVIVFFMANAITITNPYFIYFNINLPYGKKIKSYKAKNETLIELVEDAELIEEKKQTRFGKLISNTDYGAYAIENKFLLDDKKFIEKKTPESKNTFSFIYRGVRYGVWDDFNAGKQFVSEDYDPSNKLIYTITLEDHSPNTMLIKGRKSVIIDAFLRNYRMGNVRFETMQIKNICADMIKLFL